MSQGNGMAGADASARRLTRADRFLTPFEDFLNFVSASAIFVLMLLGVSQIVLRKIFNTPIFGYIDMVELSMATFAFLGAAYTQRAGAHIRMEIVVGLLKGRKLWLFEIIGTLVGMFIVAVLVWYGWDHFMRSYTLGDSTIDAEYPVWPSKLLVPIAFAFWFFRLGLQLFGFIRLALSPQAQPVAVPVIQDAAAHARSEIKETFGGE